LSRQWEYEGRKSNRRYKTTKIYAGIHSGYKEDRIMKSYGVARIPNAMIIELSFLVVVTLKELRGLRQLA
jgi:hypothetical protein